MFSLTSKSYSTFMSTVLLDQKQWLGNTQWTAEEQLKLGLFESYKPTSTRILEQTGVEVLSSS